MPTTKLIYGVGRVPKASEFSLGEIIVNVDDSKVYSKNKSNVVFEIGGGGTTIIGGESDGLGFATASISASGFFTSADTSNLIISGGTGVSVTTGSNNQIIITATGDSEITNVLTASYAHTASYVETTGIYGTLFTVSNGNEQGDIVFSDENIIAQNVGLSALATGLGETDSVTFAQVSSSGLLFASASEETTGGDNIRVIVYDTASGQFYFTGSYGGGGGDSYWFLDEGNNQLTSSRDILVKGDISSSRLFLPQGTDTQVAGIIFGEQAGNSGYIYDDGVSMHLGYNDEDIITVSSSNDFKLLVAGGARLASGHLQVEGNITASNPDGVSNMGNISASGLLFASASEETSGGDNIRAVVYNTASGQFYFTGSYGAGTDITEGDANRVLFYNSSGQLDSSSYLYFGNFESPSLNDGYRELKVGIGAGGRVNSFAGKFNHISSSIYRHNGAPIEINSNFSRIAFGNNKIDFRTFGEDFDHKGPRMSLTNTELRIGSHSDDTFGAFDELSPVDVIVTGSINTTNYLRLDATGSNTVVSAIAGALMYSASNEFYLGFS